MTTEGISQSRLPVSLADYERLAADVLDANAWAYLAGGAGDEITVRWNREGYDRLALLPRVLREYSGDEHTRVSLLGRTWDHPIFVAPIAYQRLFHPDGENAMTVAAAAQRAGMVLSMQSSTAMEHLPADADTCKWFQIYLLPDKDDTITLVRRAEAFGFEALVVTVDAPINGLRDRERRAGFTLPPGVVAAHLTALRPPASRQVSDNDSIIFQHLMPSAPTWRDITWLKSQTRLPILIKGILSPDDAERAIDVGADAIVVSNHGGRTLDTLPATIEVLPMVSKQVAGRVPVLIDGGIRRGTDVLKALALGAAAVMVGRPIVFALAVAGARGASHALRLLRDEFEVAMALTGCRTISDIQMPQTTARPISRARF